MPLSPIHNTYRQKRMYAIPFDVRSGLPKHRKSAGRVCARRAAGPLGQDQKWRGRSPKTFRNNICASRERANTCWSRRPAVESDDSLTIG